MIASPIGGLTAPTNVRERAAPADPVPTGPRSEVWRLRGPGTAGATSSIEPGALALPGHAFAPREEPMSTNTLLIVIVLVLLFGGGGFFWSRRG
ncbi:MAG: hypothetical protein IPO09_11400 [Anaeromyxobacter sp.]|nr:hypothetical protein [Anaeromyxobacter sp.]MBL0276861.1 hypothetical protein [Anaeromyxobacter sp.]